MGLRHPDGHGRPAEGSAGAEVTIQIAERDGCQVIVVKENNGSQTSAEEQAVAIPVAMLPDLKRAIATLEEASSGDQTATAMAASLNDSVGFAHPSEKEFARILDFYDIPWQYEPRSFPVEWDSEGRVISSFTPDFYLPDHDLFVELTTLKQDLVTRKNRKLRRLRDLYPEINIKVLYASDYGKLVEKFAASRTRQDQESVKGESS